MKDVKYIIFGMLLSIWIMPVNTAAQHVVLPELSESLEVTYATFLRDSLSAFDHPTDFEEQTHQLFQEIDEQNSNFDLTSSPYWLKFSLINTSEFDREWVLDFKNWSFVDFHFQEDDGQWETLHSGHLLPYNQRQYPNGNNCFFSLDVKAKDTMNAYVRLEYKFDNFIIPTNLNFKVGLRSYVDTKTHNVKRNIFIFLGIFLVMMLYHVFLYFSTRKKSYLYYIGILLLMIYMISHNSGYIVEIFSSFEEFPRWRGIFESTISSGIPILMIFFTMSLLNTATTMPKLHNFMRILVWVILGITILVGISFKTFNFLVMLATVLVVVTFIAVGITAVRRNLPSGAYYLIAYSFSLGGVVTMFLALGGAIPQTDFTSNYAMPLGYTFEVLFYSLALANIINVLKKENTQKQEKIIAQLQENQLLQTKVTRELENKVSERTKEIRAQHEIIEKEKQKSDTLLLNILPASTAEELKTKGYSTAKSFDNVSVMFTDFKDFTKICENMTPEEIVENLDYCFKNFDDITSEYKLEKIKTIGDSYMCAEGIPDKGASNPQNMILAGFKMLEFIDQWNAEKEERGETTWQMRIGINSGPITAGVVGKKKFTYDIWGETVNLASRMESSGSPGKINISEFTWNLVKDKFKFVSRGKIPAKNYEKVEMFYVEPLIK